MWASLMGGMTGGGGGGQTDHTSQGAGAPVHNGGINFGTPQQPTFAGVGPGGVGSVNLAPVLLIGGAVVVLALALKGRK